MNTNCIKKGIGSPFLGNGLSRTAMVFSIAKIADHRLTIPELNRIKEVDPRRLERIYEHIMGGVPEATLCSRLI